MTSVCLLTRGYHGQVPIPDGGGVPPSFPVGGYPHPVPTAGVPPSWSHGRYPQPVPMGGTQIQVPRGVPLFSPDQGVPPTFLIGGGTTFKGYPHGDLDGIPSPSGTGWGYPTTPGMDDTCAGYAAGGTPLAVSRRRTFLVLNEVFDRKVEVTAQRKVIGQVTKDYGFDRC